MLSALKKKTVIANSPAAKITENHFDASTIRLSKPFVFFVATAAAVVVVVAVVVAAVFVDVAVVLFAAVVNCSHG